MMQKEAMPNVALTRNENWLQAFGRLKPGASSEQAQAELSTLAGQLQQAYPETNRNLFDYLGRVYRVGFRIKM